MDLSLSEEQLSFRKLFHTFAQKEVAPLAAEIDEAEALPQALLARAAEQGLLAATIPEDRGGAGLDTLTYCLMLEELGQACLSCAVALAYHASMVARPLAEAGTPAQQETWLPRLAAGEALGALALSEPEAGSDESAVQARAVRDAEGFRLHGVKSWVSNAGAAGLFLVVACIPPASGPQGLSAFLVPRDAPGLALGAHEPTLGLRGLDMRALYLDGVRVPADALLGAESEAGALIARASEHLRLALAAAGLGAAESALELGKQFALERRQFGTSIATKQAVGNYFADTRLEIESLRHLVDYAARLADAGQPYGREAAMAKLLAARTAQSAANRMLQVHGGYGFSEEYAISRVYRDARALALAGGTDQLQRVLIAQAEFAGTGVAVAP